MKALTTHDPVGIVGSGTMGIGIAQVAASAGHPVLLFDQCAGAAQAAIGQMATRLNAQVSKGRLDPAMRYLTLSRMRVIDSLEALKACPLIIEAITENFDAKRSLLLQLEEICTKTCLLASNTSSLSITQLSAELKHPKRLLGLHFFNPAPVMPLVEVVAGHLTDPNLIKRASTIVRAWGKQPVHSRSTPGFIVNRIARPFYNESMRALEEGVSDCATLDALMREAGGFKMGAFELTDLIGQDVNYTVTCSIFEAFYGDRRFQPALIQKQRVDAGLLGRKSGQGFYDYTQGAFAPSVSEVTSDLLVSQCTVEGSANWANGLIQRCQHHDIPVNQVPGRGLLRIGDATLALTDGRLASRRALEDALPNLILVDLARDYLQTKRLAISCSSTIGVLAKAQSIGFLQQLGIKVTCLTDSPALIVLRTWAMLANEAAEALLQGVASATDIDLAMRTGLGFPQGPLAWADDFGLSNLLTVLQNLQACYGEHYRPSLLLQRKAAESDHFHS